MSELDPAAGFVVAIDGPAGSGKSSVSRRVAGALGARYLDTGAMYRAATCAELRAGADPADPTAVAKVVACCDLEMITDPEAPGISLDGIRVDQEIRGPEVTGAVSLVAAVPQVRQQLVAQQRAIAAAPGSIVVEGRDIGRIVTPNADLKIYLTASVAERARRRGLENATDVSQTAQEIQRRDHLDSTRAVDPLRQAEDAVLVDTTDLNLNQVVERILGLIQETRRT
jgi:CMP/dCMP kinase